MNNPQGTVIAISGEGLHRRAQVEVTAAAFCRRCADGKGCGAGLGAQGGKRRRIEAEIPRGADVSAGDVVGIALAPRNVLRAAAIVYGWPLVGAGLGALLAYSASFGDGAAAVSALLGLAAGAALVRVRLRQSGCLREFMPRIEV